MVQISISSPMPSIITRPTRRRQTSTSVWRGRPLPPSFGDPPEDEIIFLSYGSAIMYLMTELRPRAHYLLYMRKVTLEKRAYDEMAPSSQIFYTMINDDLPNPFYPYPNQPPFIRRLWKWSDASAWPLSTPSYNETNTACGFIYNIFTAGVLEPDDLTSCRRWYALWHFYNKDRQVSVLWLS